MKNESVALIVAAGRGTRASRYALDGPKQYVPLHRVAVITHGMRTFLRSPHIDKLQVVIHPEDIAAYEESLADLVGVHERKILPAVFGGETRQSSVLLGLEAIESLSPGSVLIHDAARPCLSSSLIEAICTELKRNKAVLPALPVGDTLKRVEANIVQTTVDRSGLWRAQTPQGFHYGDILKAHKAVQKRDDLTFTDDASIAEWFGLKVAVIMGHETNIKITTAEDFKRGELFLQQELDVRIGNGFDVHAFEEGQEITLCGVTFPFEKQLKGHSDADVGLHAITDAIYGALGEGDIGTHFPPSDPQWSGVASDVFLKHAVDRVAARGGRLSNVDVTLICEAPKIGPHSAAMRQSIADITGLRLDQISVKATTTERLGFTGRGEGISALASALVVLGG